MWMTTVLDRVSEAFIKLWVGAEHAIHSDSMNSTLVLLKTFKKDSYAHQDIAPFRVPAQQATRDRYCNLWLTYTMFCCRYYLEQVSTHTTLSDKYRIIVTPHLVLLCNHEDTVNTPAEHCVDINNLNASPKLLMPLLRKMLGDKPEKVPPTVDHLGPYLLDFCYASICHKLGTSRWSSTLMHFLARRGICPKEVRFHEGPEVSQTLAAFTYGSRLLVYSRLTKVAYDVDDPTWSLYSALQEIYQAYLHDGADAPMGKILSLMAYARAITKSTSSRSTIVWGSS
ncbi:hypothetical protein L211DRAFT_854547 [Terfezia boudieri ATCC MYA-4762]|uniref:Uncharacterized protein n=1 Tax=Terfezia boudieri ATCC MYA-4762 TaxID=1051890 RepID=A0A3N4L646_9PEZI|nr:hypothetical protein L211DRAFT_854547 [Terfezia boudieri ATCC MYA-4762]